jgi:hypothetical protein
MQKERRYTSIFSSVVVPPPKAVFSSKNENVQLHHPSKNKCKTTLVEYTPPVHIVYTCLDGEHTEHLSVLPPIYLLSVLPPSNVSSKQEESETAEEEERTRALLNST